MLKFIYAVTVVSSVASAVRPQPEFTLRTPEQMVKPLPLRGKPAPERRPITDLEKLAHELEGAERPPLPGPDPRPPKPRPEPADLKHEVVPRRKEPELIPGAHPMKPLPRLPEEHLKLARPNIRGLHGDHHDDDSHDHHDHDHDDHHDHDFHHEVKPAPGKRNLPPPGPKPTPGMGGPLGDMPPKPKPEPKAKPQPGRFGHDMMLPPPPPPPRMGGIDVKPKPKPKPKGGLGYSPLSMDRDIDMLAYDAQQQCQTDYSRLCSPRSSYARNAFRPGDSSQENFFVNMLMGNSDSNVNMEEPCDTEIGIVDVDLGDDDDADDVDLVLFNSPLLDAVHDMFSTLRLSRPMPINTPAGPKPAPLPARVPIPPVTSRMLWTQGPIVEEYFIDEPLDIGFGMDGDMCLLDNFERLSTSCQDSIDDLQMAIDEIDEDDEGGCPLLPLVLVFLLLALILRCVARRRMIKRQDSLHTTLAAIHASPDLKAKVEAASGVPVPPTLPACRARMVMSQQPWYVKLLCVLGVVVISFLVVVNSMLITGAIVNSIYDNDSDDDNASPVVALLILFSVLTVEVFLLRHLRAAVCAYLDTPATPATASTGTSSAGSDNNSGGLRSTLPQIFQRMRSVQISNLVPSTITRSRSFSSTSSGPQYEPLLSEENYEGDNTELTMVQVPASAPPASSSRGFTTIPVVVTPIDASSNVQSSISMF